MKTPTIDSLSAVARAALRDRALLRCLPVSAIAALIVLRLCADDDPLAPRWFLRLVAAWPDGVSRTHWCLMEARRRIRTTATPKESH